MEEREIYFDDVSIAPEQDKEKWSFKQAVEEKKFEKELTKMVEEQIKIEKKLSGAFSVQPHFGTGIGARGFEHIIKKRNKLREELKKHARRYYHERPKKNRTNW